MKSKARQEEFSDINAIPLWHSLMYTTGMLLIILGIPGTMIGSVVMLMSGDYGWSGSEAIVFNIYLIIPELCIAGLLLIAARLISKLRKQKPYLTFW